MYDGEAGADEKRRSASPQTVFISGACERACAGVLLLRWRLHTNGLSAAGSSQSCIPDAFGTAGSSQSCIPDAFGAAGTSLSSNILDAF